MRLTRTSADGSVLVELVRLSVVVLTTAAAFGLGETASGNDRQLLWTSLGAAVGYVAGGTLGRCLAGRVDATERRLRSVPSQVMLSATIGAILGLVVAGALTWPVLLLDGKVFTVPVAMIVTVVTTAVGVRVGMARGGDLLRSLGATGRLEVSTAGRRAKVVDTSALVDARLVEVCRAGFVEGTLVVPRFVLYELQGLADAGDPERRLRGRRGLDALAALQRSAGVALQVSERDHPEIADVDAKLVAIAREAGAALITVDGNLGRVAEIQGVAVLNLHALADRLRPPVLPGDRLDVRVVKAGREAGQGVGYLSDGTMVVVEGGRGRLGEEVAAEVTSILNNPNGRMVFATAVPAAAARRPVGSGIGA